MTCPNGLEICQESDVLTLISSHLQTWESHLETPCATQSLTSIINWTQKKWKAWFSNKDHKGDEEQKEQSEGKMNRENSVMAARRQGHLKRGEKQQYQLQQNSQQEWGRRKGHWVYHCISSFFMSGKQLIQKGSVGLKATKKRRSTWCLKKQKNVKRYQERFTSRA